MKRHLIMCLILMLLGSDKALTQGEEEPNTLGYDERFITEFLRLHFPGYISKGIPLVIEDKFTSPVEDLGFGKTEDEFCADLVLEAENKNKRLSEAVRELCRRNTEMYRINPMGKIGIKYIPLTEEDIKDLFSGSYHEGWEKFYKIYPDSPGIITVSRPGFSRGGKIAVIYMWNQVADLAGHGRIFVLEKRNGKWLYSVMVVGPLNVVS